MTNAGDANGVRLDIWLWAARFFKTRSLAKQAIEGGKIDLNELAGKPSRPVRVGDVLRIVRGDERFEIAVAALAEQRGPAAAAQQLYQETEASRLAREAQRDQQRLAGKGYLRPPSRPDKRSRRLIRRFKDAID